MTWIDPTRGPQDTTDAEYVRRAFESLSASLPIITSKTPTMPNNAGPGREWWDTSVLAKGVRKYWDGTSFRPDGLQVIERQVLGGSTASVTFSTIPAAFDSLRIEVIARGTVAAANANMLMRFNGDTGNNYSSQLVQSNNGTVGGGAGPAGTSMQVAYIVGTTSGANSAVPVDINIPFSSAGNFDKTFTSTFGLTSTNDNLVGSASGQRRNAAAITSITLLLDAGNFAANSRFTLYGLG